MTDNTANTALAQELETLSRQSEAGTLMMYGEPDVGLSSQPFFGEPLKGDMRPLADWHGADADLVIALWNNLPTILAALRTPAPAPVGGGGVASGTGRFADRWQRLSGIVLPEMVYRTRESSVGYSATMGALPVNALRAQSRVSLGQRVLCR